jgi:hypothetical protein
MQRELTEIEKALPPVVELVYVAYENAPEKKAGYLGYYEKDDKVWAWVDENGKFTYAVDLI